MIDILFLDNIDSFTYNLVDQIRRLHHNVYIYRNYISLDIIKKVIFTFNNPVIVLSPGSGRPQQAGCMPTLINFFKGRIPIIGICLGHQALIESYGGIVHSSKEILHGKNSLIHHDNKYMFTNMDNPLAVARYHSLVCSTQSYPKNLIINAYYNDMVMAFRNNSDRTCGFQFHPESILTTQGTRLMEQTLNWAIKK